MNAQLPLVLVVDDNEMNRDMLARRLERQGCRSILAEDGVQALEVLAQHSFDLILLDIMMPRMTGYEVLERVKQDTSTRHIPVIMISALDDLDSVVKCIENGADDYLFKPFNPVLLKARISASLDKKRLHDQERNFLQQNQSEDAAEANKLLLREFFTTLGNGSEKRSAIGENYSLYDGAGRKVNFDQVQQIFKGLTFHIEDTIAENDRVMTRLNIGTESIIIISHISHHQIIEQQLFATQSDWLQKHLA